MVNKIYNSVDVHVQARMAHNLAGAFDRTVSRMQQNGWEVELITSYNGKEWDYPNYEPTIGYNIIFSRINTDVKIKEGIMKLETIAQTYGMEDYLDSVTGYIYELSKATDNGNGTLKIPVKENGVLIGYSTMDKVEEAK